MTNDQGTNDRGIPLWPMNYQPRNTLNTRKLGQAALVEVVFVQAEVMAEFVEVGDADFIIEIEVFVVAEMKDWADVDEDGSQGFGKVVGNKAMKLPEHFLVVGRPFLKKCGDFLRLFLNGRRQRFDGALDDLIRAIEQFLPGQIVGGFPGHIT